ncbi:MAG: glycosyltransferase family 4 protein [Bacillota bacterium]|nr:glycosyltransferase family 4 protein [Bacillota bacterium]
MKICILTSGHCALDDRIFYKEVLSLKKKYSDITIIAPDKKSEYLEDEIKIIGVSEPNSIMERLKIVDKIIDKAIEVNADIYHFHDFEIIYKIGKVKKFVPQAKIVYDVHEHYPDMMRMSRKIPKVIKNFAAFFVDKSEQIISKKFEYIITADDAVRERFQKFNKNVDVIYNFSEFKINIDEKIEKEYDAIYQGGITLERGLMQVIKAIEIIKHKKNDVKMIFVGPFGDENAKNIALQYIKDNNLQNNVLFLGKVPHIEVERYIRKSKIGIVTLLPLPKYYKNIPIKQFEYMSCGIPVIGSDLPPIKKFIESYNSGKIVDPTNPQEIADAIYELLENEQLRKDLGSNGVRAVTEEYNWSNMESKLLSIYDKL